MAIENAFDQRRDGKSGYRLAGVNVLRRIVIAGQNDKRTDFSWARSKATCAISAASTPLKSRLLDCK